MPDLEAPQPVNRRELYVNLFLCGLLVALCVVAYVLIFVVGP